MKHSFSVWKSSSLYTSTNSILQQQEQWQQQQQTTSSLEQIISNLKSLMNCRCEEHLWYGTLAGCTSWLNHRRFLHARNTPAPLSCCHIPVHPYYNLGRDKLSSIPHKSANTNYKVKTKKMIAVQFIFILTCFYISCRLFKINVGWQFFKTEIFFLLNFESRSNFFFKSETEKHPDVIHVTHNIYDYISWYSLIV